MARNAQLFVNYRAEFAEPGNYDVTFTAITPGDTAPDNDSLTRAVIVRPFNDIPVAGDLDMAELFGGQTRVKTFTVTTDRRPLATARFVAGHCLPRRCPSKRSAPRAGIATSTWPAAASATSPTSRRSPSSP